MNEKTVGIAWPVSLIVIGIATLIHAGSRLMGIVLPDAVVRTAGIADILALPVLAFTSVKKAAGKK